MLFDNDNADIEMIPDSGESSSEDEFHEFHELNPILFIYILYACLTVVLTTIDMITENTLKM